MDAKNAYLEGKLLKGAALHKVGLDIGGRILRNGRIHQDELWDQTQNIETMKTLLSINVFVMVPCSPLVVFESKLIEHVAKELYHKSLAGEKKWWWMLGD